MRQNNLNAYQVSEEAEAPLERGDLYLVTYTARGHAAGLYPFHIAEVGSEIARGVDWLRNPTPAAWVAVGLAPSKIEAMAIVDGLSEELERLGRPIRVVAS